MIRAFALVLGILACSLVCAGQSSSPDALVDDFVKAWNSHDAAAVGRLFEMNAVWVTLAELRSEGRENIQKDFADAHSTWARTIQVQKKDVDFRMLGPKIAVGLFRLSFLKADGVVIPHSERALMVVLRRSKGVWRIVSGQLAHPTPV